MPFLNSTSPAAVLAGLGRVLSTRALDKAEVEAAAPAIEALVGSDLVDAVDTLVAEGIPEKDLKVAVSRLLNLASKRLAKFQFEPEDPFFKSLVLENEGLLARLAGLRPFVASLATGAAREEIEELRLRVAELAAIELHFQKKENILFPYFEARYPRYRCLSLMWSLHDDVRASLSGLVSILKAESLDAKAAGSLVGRLFDAHALVLREEKLLFPLAAGLLSLGERRDLFKESTSLGFCFVEAEKLVALELDCEAERLAPPPAGSSGAVAGGDRTLSLDSGSLDPLLVDLILKTLPVDLTFVDAQDRVAYFSNGEARVFPRSPSIIGRDVRNCHPAKSVGRVLAILESFRDGSSEREEFWLETGGRFVRIEYRALRDSRGLYLGTLEMSQDLTAARALTGERRLATS